jgi:prepilin-type N-terminal cleavage/methylation domain-containing protein
MRLLNANKSARQTTGYRLLATGYSRKAFTLIEVLVVMLIIALMAGLLTAAIMKAFGRGRQAQTVTEINELALAVENFRVRYGFYPPSRIHLCEKLTYYPGYSTGGIAGMTSTFDQESVGYLTRMFPRLDTSATGLWAAVGINWNGNTNALGADIIDPSPGAGDVILEGDQCLVFFLGGIPAGGLDPSSPYANRAGPPACIGFSVNSTNPAANAAAGGDVLPILYDFSGSRLVLVHGIDPVTGLPNGNLFYSYGDYWASVSAALNPAFGSTANLVAGRPYAFFSSYGKKNGYNRYFNVLAPTTPISSDCKLLGVWPYAEAMPPAVTTERYVKSETFQIISAGADGPQTGGGFGSGTVITTVNATGHLVGAPTWTATSPSGANPPGTPGADDLSNFHDTLLGAGG